MTAENNKRSIRPVGRRNVLKTIGGASIALPATNIVQASSPVPSDVVIVTGSVDDPIDEVGRENARSTAFDDFVDRGNELTNFGNLERVKPVKTVPKSDDPIVVYGYVLDEDGVPHTYTGSTAEQSQVGSLRKEAEEQLGRFER